MKELSIVEKAKRYDEALTKARNIVNSINVGLIGKDSFEAVFPELRESEDERIRKAIVKMISDIDGGSPFEKYGIIKKEALAWLEKQGEQKPTDKVEPKFKQGDWIVFNGLVLRVGGVSGGFYVTTSKDGITNGYDWSIDNAARLWTIQDAKEGDIIFSNDGHGSDSIEIIKSISDKRIDFWFCLSSKNNFKDCYYDVFDGIIPYTNFASREGATPATKEQRDLLFQKMKEAGYDWDSHTNKMIYNNDYRRLR